MFLNLLKSRSAVLAGAAGVAGAAAVTYASSQTFNRNFIAEAESKKPKLVYFDLPGRAFVIRAALRYAKVPFEDVRVDYPELVKQRGPAGANEKVPLGQLPIIELPNGEVICQSVPILRWAARQSDLYPKDIDQALLVDEVVESVTEFRSKLPDAKDESERKKLREEYVANVLPKYFDYFSRRLQKSGGPYFLGKQFSMADLYLARVIDGFVQKKFDFVDRDSFAKWPAVLAHYEAVKRHPIFDAEVKADEAFQKSKKAAH